MMDVESLAKELILKNMTPEQQAAVLDSVHQSVAQAKEVQKRKIGENVDLVVQALKKIESDIRDRFDSVGNAIEKRVSSIQDGRDGSNGKDGRDGKDGKSGRDGAKGDKGNDGKDGRDGVDGTDGVSVTNAHIDFDGSLIITLSTGVELNVGEVVAPDLAEHIKVITNGGGTSQSVIDTLASLQAQITALIPSQTGNSGKFLTTNGSTLSWGNPASSGFSNTAAAGTTTVLTSSSVKNYVVTGSGGQTFQLPNATTLTSGDIYTFNNNQSSGTIIVKNNSSTTISTVQSGGYVSVVLLSNATAAGSWDVHNFAPSNVSWSTNTFDYAGSITSATWNGTSIAYNRGGTGQSSAFVAGGIVYGSTTSALAVTGIGTSGQVLTSAGAGTPTWTTPTTGTVTSVSGTAPVSVATGTTTPVISLAASYGDTQNPYASKTLKYVLAAPNGADGVPTFRALVASDIPTLNQSTTGSAATLTTPRAIYGNNFDGSAALTQIIASTYGGTGNGFTKFTGATTAERTYTLPDATTTILTTNAAVTIAQGGTGQTTASAAFNALAPSQTSNSGKYLTTDGTTTSWGTISATGTVTSVAATVPAFLSVTGSPITTSGTLAISYSGTALPVANGGSGATTLSGVLIGNGTSAFTTKTNPSGAFVGTTDTQTLTNKTIQGGAITSGTVVASTSGTSIDFTSIPSWVKRITVIFDLTSTNGSSNLLMQIGNGSIINTGYTSLCLYAGGSSNTGSATSTAGCLLTGVNGAAVQATGSLQLVLQTSNTWILSGTLTQVSFNQVSFSSGRIALGGALDRVRITTANGTDTFDAGAINILYEG
jgi:hypothetical protein